MTSKYINSFEALQAYCEGNEPVVLTRKLLYERIEACDGSVDAFLKESLGKYAYVEVQLWDRIQI